MRTGLSLREEVQESEDATLIAGNAILAMSDYLLPKVREHPFTTFQAVH
jgi:hypothetical protein